MNIITSPISGLVVIEPRIFHDNRGYFYELYNEVKAKENKITYRFIQDNVSRSHQNVIRGLHYQLAPFAQTKLVSVLEGKIFDVAVDIRKDSPTFGHWYGLELSYDNHLQLLIPCGFAHGFSVLSKEAVVNFKCDNAYHSEAERGIIYNDPSLDIDWHINPKDAIISSKDK